MIPNALGKLGVGHFPRAIRTTPGSAAAHACLVIPRPSPYGMWIRLAGLVPWIEEDCALGTLFVNLRVVLIQGPLHDVSVDVIQTPGIGLFSADLLIFEIAVLFEPGVLAELGRFI